MTIRRGRCAAVLLVSPVISWRRQPRRRQEAGGVDPASLLKPLAESWPTYSGDYTGRRFSALTQVNRQPSRTSRSRG